MRVGREEQRNKKRIRTSQQMREKKYYRAIKAGEREEKRATHVHHGCSLRSRSACSRLLGSRSRERAQRREACLRDRKGKEESIGQSGQGRRERKEASSSREPDTPSPVSRNEATHPCTIDRSATRLQRQPRAPTRSERRRFRRGGHRRCRKCGARGRGRRCRAPWRRRKRRKARVSLSQGKRHRYVVLL